MAMTLALRTCALILKHAGTIAPALVAIIQTPSQERDKKMLLAGKLGEVLLADQQILTDIQEIIENLLGHRVESPVPILDVLSELKVAWNYNRMNDWLILGRNLDLFTQRDIAAWAWLLTNWEVKHNGSGG